MSESESESTQSSAEPADANVAAQEEVQAEAVELTPEAMAAMKIASLTEELEAQKDKAMRLVAEFDNFRKRSAREYADMREAALGKAFEGLYPVVDNFERAFQDAPAEGDWTPADPAGFAKGLRLIRDQLRKVFADAGLEEIASEGAAFDPNLHDALTQMPHETVPKDHVIQAFARGWKKGDRILRHAQVIVSSGPAA